MIIFPLVFLTNMVCCSLSVSFRLKTEKLNVDDIQFEKMNTWDGVKAYAQTKRAQVTVVSLLSSVFLSNCVGYLH